MDDVMSGLIFKFITAAMGAGGLYLILNGLHLSRKYMDITDIPPSFLKSQVEFCGHLKRIESDGSILIEHVPIVGLVSEELSFTNLTSHITKFYRLFFPLIKDRETNTDNDDDTESCLKFRLWGLNYPLSPQAIQWINENTCGATVYFQIMDLTQLSTHSEREVSLHNCILYYRPVGSLYLQWNPWYYMVNKQLLRLGLAQCDPATIQISLEKGNTQSAKNVLAAIRIKYDSTFEQPPEEGINQNGRVKISPFSRTGAAGSLNFEAQLALALYAGQSAAQKRGLGPWMRVARRPGTLFPAGLSLGSMVGSVLQHLKALLFSQPTKAAPPRHPKAPPPTTKIVQKMIKLLARTK